VVTQIDYSGTTVRVTTSAGDVYEAKKVICTLPLGVLKASTVTFTPSLPSSYQTAIGNMGFGVFNKVVAFLNDTFWTSGNSVVDFIANSGQPFTFPEAYVVPDATHKILMFFVSGSTSTTLNAQTDSQIITNLTNTLANFINIGDYSITSYLITRWEQDPYAKGSYSFYKVGNTKADY
jgi:monoamine oxidase